MCLPISIAAHSDAKQPLIVATLVAMLAASLPGSPTRLGTKQKTMLTDTRLTFGFEFSEPRDDHTFTNM
jgi:hypothetical protein